MSFKQELHACCHLLVDERIHRSKQLMDEAQQAANLESKSSAGDKYETGRAMMMLEIEKAGTQLQEALKLKRALDDINLGLVKQTIALGSLVETSLGTYYLSISLGKIVLENKEVFVLSAVSPLGDLLIGKSVGDRFTFNSREYEIKSIE